MVKSILFLFVCILMPLFLTGMVIQDDYQNILSDFEIADILRKPRNLERLSKTHPNLVKNLRRNLFAKKSNKLTHRNESTAQKDDAKFKELKCYDTKMGAFFGPLFCSPKRLLAV